MQSFWLMLLAGAAGTGARYGLTLATQKWLLVRTGSHFPLGTLLINVAGCFILAAIVTLVAQRTLSPEARLVVGTGFCGAFTTFSTFALETEELWRRAPTQAAIYCGANLVLGIAAVILARVLVKMGTVGP